MIFFLNQSQGLNSFTTLLDVTRLNMAAAARQLCCPLLGLQLASPPVALPCPFACLSLYACSLPHPLSHHSQGWCWLSTFHFRTLALFYLVSQTLNEHTWTGAVEVSDTERLFHLTDVGWAKRRHRKVCWHFEVGEITLDDRP